LHTRGKNQKKKDSSKYSCISPSFHSPFQFTKRTPAAAFSDFHSGLKQNPAPLISPKLDKKLIIPHNTTLQKSLKPTTNHHEHPHEIPQTVLDKKN